VGVCAMRKLGRLYVERVEYPLLCGYIVQTTRHGQ
jgi:hypothetical protein